MPDIVMVAPLKRVPIFHKRERQNPRIQDPSKQSVTTGSAIGTEKSTLGSMCAACADQGPPSATAALRAPSQASMRPFPDSNTLAARQ